MMLYVGLGFLALVLVILFATGERGVGGVAADDLAALASLSALLLLILAGFRSEFRDRFGQNLRHLLIWLVLGALAVAAYAYREQARQVGGTLLGALRPGQAVVGPAGEVTIRRRSDGDFSVLATVNGRAEQRFIFDTGASTVVLTAENAATLGLRPAENAYSVRVSTANGTALAAPVLLDAIAVGPLTERRVEALVSRPGALSANLLGHTFLDRLASYEVRGDSLVLRAR